jgi:tol-pal system protein YbgF
MWFVVVVAGCASGPAPAGSGGTATTGSPDDSLRELARSQNDQARRIAELEARLTLLEADARRARGFSDKPTGTVRIGETSREEPTEELALTTAAPPQTDVMEHANPRRPNLKLSGRNRSRAADSGELPPVPITDETLAVVPLPQERSRARQAEAESAAAVSDSPTSDYRAALHLVRERRFQEAALALSKFVSDNPNHALLDRAMYWLAEVRYATRDYREALAGFEKVLERFPNSEKTPDALYKLGMCWRRLGSEDKARSYFRRLRTQYPNSEAAGLASSEGST